MSASGKALRWFTLLSVAALVGCASTPPFRTTQKFDAVGAQLQTIGFYPLVYSTDGKDQRNFGKSFTAALLDSAAFLTYRQPLRIIGPDSLVILLELNGAAVTGEKRGVFGDKDTMPVADYRRLTPSDLAAIAKEVDGVVVCNLEDYFESDAMTQAMESVVVGLLFGTAASSAIKNKARMRFTLMQSSSGDTLWEFWPSSFSQMVSDPRKGFVKDFVKGFQKNFPLCAE